jgi:methionyl-tRNA formyltransferase
MTMIDDLRSLRFVLAGYGMPAEFALHELFGAGVAPEQILLLTQESDARNAGLVSLATLRGVTLTTEPASRDATVRRVEAHEPDIVASIHYRSRIPGTILSAARLGTINLHPSLLPRYRGTNSVPWVIINGETETGFTFHSMTEEFDTGRILLQQRMAIDPQDTAFSLFHRQIVAAMPRLGEVVRMVASGEPGEPQEGEGSYYPRSVPHGGLIDLAWDDDKVERFIRAMYFPPFEPARLVVDGSTHLVPTMDVFRSVTGR